MIVPLSQVAEINPKADLPTHLAQNAMLDFLPMADVSEAGVVSVSAQRPLSEVQKGFTAFRKGDILIAKITPCFENNKIAVADIATEFGFGSTEFHVVRCQQSRLDSRYVLHLLRSNDVRAEGKRRMTGSAGQQRVPKKFLEELQIPLPPLEEQKRIAAILDQADELRRKRQRALDRLNQLGQAIFIEMFGDPASNPRGFDAKPLGEIIEFIGGSQPAKSHFLYEPGPDRIRFIQIRDFRTDKYPTYVPKALAKRPFSEDDVMIGRYGPPVFQIFRGLSGTYNVALMKAKPRRNLTSDFVFYLLQEPRLHSYVVANSERTAGQSGVNLELLEKYPAFEPPMPLLIAFSEQIAALNAQLLAACSAAERVEALFTSLQHRAFRGELTASSLKEAAA